MSAPPSGALPFGSPCRMRRRAGSSARCIFAITHGRRQACLAVLCVCGVRRPYPAFDSVNLPFYPVEKMPHVSRAYVTPALPRFALCIAAGP